MAHERNIAISAAGTAGVRLTFCSTAYTGSYSCTSYPVFSFATTDGTNRYSANSPLKQLYPAGSYSSANNPSVAFSTASGTALITFAYGSTFSDATPEYSSGGVPRRYRYILHRSGHTPATAYSAAVTAGTAVVAYGSVDMRVVSTASQSFATVCASSVEGSVSGGL